MSRARVRRFLYSLTAFVGGSLILLISFVDAAQTQAIAPNASSQKSMYFDRPIKPDHVLYPLVAAQDHFQLLTARPEERYRFQFQFAQNRLETSHHLVKEHPDLATVTAFKGVQYLVQSYETTKELSEPEKHQAQTFIRSQLPTFESQLHSLQGSIPSPENSQLDPLLARLEGLDQLLASDSAAFPN